MTGQLEWSLYENGMDSIKHGIEHYVCDTDEKRKYKYAILHMSQGVMLLLKERLRLEHPNFVFTNVADESKTVDVDVLLSRLKKVAKVEFTDDQEKVVRELAELRNKIEHFALRLSRQQADNVIARLLPFLIVFTRQELHRSFNYEIGEDNWKALLLSQEFRANAIKHIENRLRIEGEKVFFCSDCQAYTAIYKKRDFEEFAELRLDCGDVICQVCNSWVCGLVKCQECGKLIEHKTLPQYVCYCDECAGKLKRDFPEFADQDTSVLFLIGELQRWFTSHDQIDGRQFLQLLGNVRGPGSGHYYPAKFILEKKIIDFVSDQDRVLYDTLNGLRPTMGVNFNDYDRFEWAYST